MALAAGEGIGIAGVHDERARRAVSSGSARTIAPAPSRSWIASGRPRPRCPRRERRASDPCGPCSLIPASHAAKRTPSIGGIVRNGCRCERGYGCCALGHRASVLQLGRLLGRLACHADRLGLDLQNIVEPIEGPGQRRAEGEIDDLGFREVLTEPRKYIISRVGSNCCSRR